MSDDQIKLFEDADYFSQKMPASKEKHIVYAEWKGKITDHIRIMQLIEKVQADPKDQRSLTDFYMLTKVVSKRLMAMFVRRWPAYYEPDEWSTDVACMFYEKVFVKKCAIRSSATTAIGYLCQRRLYYRRMCEMEGSLDQLKIDIYAREQQEMKQCIDSEGME